MPTKKKNNSKNEHLKKSSHKTNKSEHVSKMKKHETHSATNEKNNKKDNVITINKNLFYGGVVLAIILLVVALVAVFGGFSSSNKTLSSNNSTSENLTNSSKVQLLVVSDSRCAECDVTPIIPQLESLVGEVDLVYLDYTTEEGKAKYEELGLTTLPAILFTSDISKNKGFSQLQNYLEPKGKYLNLRVGATFDPTKEICNNGVDDNDDGLVDCADSTCSTDWTCQEKVDKPVVELFVMSYCPYGTQMEKGILPVVKLLGDNIDFQLKFVNYAMHGKKELDEELNQYCIKEEYGQDSLNDYLMCFLNTSGGSSDEIKSCINKLGFNSDTLKSCIKKADEEFGISKDYADRSTWRGNFPYFSIFNSDNLKYGVQGSPTLVVNGMSDVPAGRDSASILAAICSTFKSAPEVCNTKLSSATPSAGFGFGEATNGNLAQCG